MAKHSLTPQQVEHYRTEGYLVVESVFDRTEVRQVHDVIYQVTRDAIASGKPDQVLELEPEPINGQRVPRRIYNPYEQHEVFSKLANDDRIVERIASLIGPDIGLHHSKLNMKPPKVGSIVEWHQDLAYFPHTNDDLVTTLIHLDDATRINGCLQVLPRHHSHYFEHRRASGEFSGMITETIDDGRFGKPVALEAPAGSVIFLHCITPHASLPNCSDKPRRTLIFEYRAADAFPIYFSEYVSFLESHAQHLRGDRARFARHAGPTPMIPNMPRQYAQSQSLYSLQEQTRSQAAVATSSD